MRALGRLPAAQGLAAMQSINVAVIGNVPMNNALTVVDATSHDGASVWARYLVRWTAWNHVRTAASLAACVAFILAITAR